MPDCPKARYGKIPIRKVTRAMAAIEETNTRGMWDLCSIAS